MNIGTFGCSFVAGYGVSEEDTWSYLLGARNWGRSGASNDIILERVLRFYDKFDTIIVCWSSPVRKMLEEGTDVGLFRYNRRFIEKISYEKYHDLKQKHFDSFDLNGFYEKWQRQIDIVEALGIDCIHTSAFGDVPLSLPKKWATPMLTKLAPELKFNIEFFEYDMLLKDNEIVEEWANKNLIKDWKLAAIERNLLRKESKNFLSCGHPSPEGHRIYAEYMKDYLSRVSP